MQTSETRQRLQQLLGETMSKISASFMELSNLVGQSSANASPDAKKSIDRIFRLYLESHRSLANEVTALLDGQEKLEHSLEGLNEERRRLEVLYTSGIQFSSETEMRALMSRAIETVISELHADEGFIVLADEAGTPDTIVARNMDPDAHPEAREMSNSVIRTTLATAAPTNLDNDAAETTFARQQSIIRLGITAALCVPLVSGTSVLGAVYIDRRNQERKFTESDLTFLLAFARQIVRGMAISLEIATLEKKINSEADLKFEQLRREFNSPEIVGTSRKLFEILKVAARIAPSEASVLLLGENGTGKDLLAQVIHRNSPRANKPFITINCGAIPHDLLESELFGYESGAFTGATKAKQGKLELADGGTIFFDEIGELSVNLQAKLLRMLQTREIERLGGITAKKIDVRIISATNRDLGEMISKGSFREDLYYRLKVIELFNPPLRERREDISVLASYFLAKHAPDKGYTLTPAACEILEHYSWPGNIRELDHVILRCTVLAHNAEIDVADLPPELQDPAHSEPIIATGLSLSEAEEEFRRNYILRTLRQTTSKADAAKALGVNRTHFYKLLAQLGID